MDGEKVSLGFIRAATENESVVKEFLNTHRDVGIRLTVRAGMVSRQNLCHIQPRLRPTPPKRDRLRVTAPT